MKFKAETAYLVGRGYKIRIRTTPTSIGTIQEAVRDYIARDPFLREVDYKEYRSANTKKRGGGVILKVANK